jgi:hypothetical protein
MYIIRSKGRGGGNPATSTVRAWWLSGAAHTPPLHCTAPTALHCPHCTALPPLHCTAHSPPQPAASRRPPKPSERAFAVRALRKALAAGSANIASLLHGILWWKVRYRPSTPYAVSHLADARGSGWAPYTTFLSIFFSKIRHF